MRRPTHVTVDDENHANGLQPPCDTGAPPEVRFAASFLGHAGTGV